MKMGCVVFQAKYQIYFQTNLQTHYPLYFQIKFDEFNFKLLVLFFESIHTIFGKGMRSKKSNFFS